MPKGLLLAGKAEARWKRWVSSTHRSLCGCSDFLNHFRWPTPLDDAGDTTLEEGATGVATDTDAPGEKHVTFATGHEDSDKENVAPSQQPNR
ncbi:ORF2 [Grizzly bear anellovirus 10]|nr:ORF2 [Grizzly bear anellovirus 10]